MYYTCFRPVFCLYVCRFSTQHTSVYEWIEESVSVPGINYKLLSITNVIDTVIPHHEKVHIKTFCHYYCFLFLDNHALNYGNILPMMLYGVWKGSMMLPWIHWVSCGLQLELYFFFRLYLFRFWQSGAIKNVCWISY